MPYEGWRYEGDDILCNRDTQPPEYVPGLHPASRRLGVSLPIEGSCDEEIWNKCFETSSLIAALREWKTQDVTVDDREDDSAGRDPDSSCPGDDRLDMRPDSLITGDVLSLPSPMPPPQGRTKGSRGGRSARPRTTSLCLGASVSRLSFYISRP